VTTETEDSVPCRPWTLTLEVEHLEGPSFDLDQHGDDIEDVIINLLRDVVIDLDGGTSVRIETHVHRIGDETLLEGEL
jgi:hypothetical protein